MQQKIVYMVVMNLSPLYMQYWNEPLSYSRLITHGLQTLKHQWAAALSSLFYISWAALAVKNKNKVCTPQSNMKVVT
jgi:hypothetical protein